tara:strand:+ start:13673 stop:14884 length:1212 start_codon:yes stop_codon:yes gene_type:complete
MLSKLRSYWKYGNTFCGIELTTLEGKEKLFGATAKKRQGEFTNLNFLQFSLTDVDKNLPKQQHCFLAINSDKVLIKSVPNLESDLKTVSAAFPGLSLSDFYYEILKTPYNSIVSICRKDYVQNVLRVLERQQIHVLGFHLGITPLQVLVPLLKKDEVSIPRYQIGIEDNNIRDLVSNEHSNGTTYELEDIKVASEYLLSLALLFNYTGSAAFNSSNNFVKENKNLSKLHQEKVFFKKGMFLGVGLLLVSLLVNTFFFNAYFKKEQQLYEESVFLEAQQKGMEGKMEAVTKKEQLVDHILNSGTSKSSYYLNRIVAVKPSSIGFSDIQYQPLNRSIRPDKPIEYSQNNIVVSGESKDKGDFSQWITEMGKQKWVEKVSVLHYGNAGKDTSTFSITINIKNGAKN